ncbi:hypothetical protein BGZ63DRAFT_209306 [Mariannaea sp. PMI_226]|nr:hypothetical protein BGZ63DRAFT_209306 [Mariannaea sp. PMI_226]
MEDEMGYTYGALHTSISQEKQNGGWCSASSKNLENQCRRNQRQWVVCSAGESREQCSECSGPKTDSSGRPFHIVGSIQEQNGPGPSHPALGHKPQASPDKLMFERWSVSCRKSARTDVWLVPQRRCESLSKCVLWLAFCSGVVEEGLGLPQAVLNHMGTEASLLYSRTRGGRSK